MRHCFLHLAIIAYLLFPQHARAAITVSIQDTSVGAGETAFVNALISSDNADVLDVFTIALQIVPLDGRQDLHFTNPPLDPQFVAPSTPPYVFPLADSFTANNPPPLTAVVMIDYLNDSYLGGDSTISQTGHVVPEANRLLARIQVTADANARYGDRYEVRVINASFLAPPDLLDITFNATSGIVVITPEPASMCVMASLLAVGLVGSRISRRKFSTQ